MDCYFHMEQGMSFSIQLPAFRTESKKIVKEKSVPVNIAETFKLLFDKK